MNWLAHLHLSGSDPATQVGNVLPDMLGLAEVKALPKCFQHGVALHRAIDEFTDGHPVFRRTVSRFASPLRRFGGVLSDVFYDHFLAANWCLYSDQALEPFIARFYGSFDSFTEVLPESAVCRLLAMRDANWLCSYRNLAGIDLTLQRIEMRFSRPIALRNAMLVLESDYDGFARDFREFYPALQTYVREQRRKLR
jgi:acyl carrier protein phosphodiesterase